MKNVTDLFSSRLKKLRGNKNQADVAKEIGISRGALSYYESGERKPDINVLCSIADYYKVSADYLLGISDTPTLSPEKKNIADSLGLSEASIDFLLAFNKERKRTPTGNFDTEPTLADVCIRTVNLLLENVEDDKSLMIQIAAYLFGTFTHFYDDDTVSDENIYRDSYELGLWDADLGMPLPFTQDIFSKAILMNIQELLIDTRKYVQNNLLPERRTPPVSERDLDLFDEASQ